MTLLLCYKNQGRNVRDKSDLLERLRNDFHLNMFNSFKIGFEQRTDNFGVYTSHEHVHVGTLKFTLVNCAHIGRSSTPAVVWVTNFLWVSFLDIW